MNISNFLKIQFFLLRKHGFLNRLRSFLVKLIKRNKNEVDSVDFYYYLESKFFYRILMKLLKIDASYFRKEFDFFSIPKEGDISKKTNEILNDLKSKIHK